MKESAPPNLPRVLDRRPKIIRQLESAEKRRKTCGLFPTCVRLRFAQPFWTATVAQDSRVAEAIRGWVLVQGLRTAGTAKVGSYRVHIAFN